MKPSILMLTVIAAWFSGCSTAEHVIKRQAETLCRYNELTDPTLEVFPSGVRAEDYLRPADLEFLKDLQAARDARERGTSKEALRTTITPTLGALAQAMQEKTTCEVTKVSVQGNNAHLEGLQARPKLKAATLLVGMSAIATASSDAARLQKAREYLADSEVQTMRFSLDFVRVNERWLADFGLPERSRLAMPTFQMTMAPVR